MKSKNMTYDSQYKQRITTIITKLNQKYGSPESADRQDPVESVITTILSQNTTDTNRDRAKKKLDETYQTYQQIVDAPVSNLADTIAVAGLGPTKAERIQTFLQRIKEEQGQFTLEHVQEMSKDEAKTYLQSFSGIGPKTAAVTLCFAFNMPVMPVDTHVYRVSKRLGLIPEDISRSKAHTILEQHTPDQRIYEFHINLIKHGRSVCTARSPTCQESILAAYCEYCPCQKNT